MSIEVARNSAYAHLGEAWLRYQSARILQRHLQYGQHCRLDLETLLAAVAGTSASRNLNNRVSNSAFDKQPSTLSTSVRVSKLAINRNVLGPLRFDLNQRPYVLAPDGAATDVDRERRSVTRPRLRFPVAVHEMTSSVNLIVYPTLRGF